MIYTRVEAEVVGVNVKQFWDTGHNIKLSRNKFHFNLCHTFCLSSSKFYISAGTVKRRRISFVVFRRLFFPRKNLSNYSDFISIKNDNEYKVVHVHKVSEIFR